MSGKWNTDDTDRADERGFFSGSVIPTGAQRSGGILVCNTRIFSRFVILSEVQRSRRISYLLHASEVIPLSRGARRAGWFFSCFLHAPSLRGGTTKQSHNPHRIIKIIIIFALILTVFQL